MIKKDIVETIYGKFHKFEIVKHVGILTAPTFYIRKDGKPFRGSFSSLKTAVEAAKAEG